MNQHKPIRRFLAAFLSVAMVTGWFPGWTTETASASTIVLTTGSTPPTVIKIAAGRNNSMVLLSDGTVVMWGMDTDNWAKPPEGLNDVVDIYAKDTVFIARKSNGMVVAWGSNAAGEATFRSDLGKYISMASANSHTLAVVETNSALGVGGVVGWGLNGNGQAVVPDEVATGGVTKVAAGSYYSMALKTDGTVVGWGSNGTGSTSMPPGLSGVVDIDAGSNYALALKSNGTVVAWGQDYNGNGITNVSSLTNVKAISANKEYALALKNDGTVVAWGATGGWLDRAVPASLTNVKAIAAGTFHALALKSDGTVISWVSSPAEKEVHAVPGDGNLSGLTVTGAGTVTPSAAFDSSHTEYQYDIDPGTTSVDVNAVLTDTNYSALYINDQRQTSGSAVKVSVPTTGAEIKVKVVPYLKPLEAKTYTLKVTRDRVAPAITFTPDRSVTALKSVETTVKVTDATSGVNPSTLKYAWTQSASTPASGDWTSFTLATADSKQFTYTGADGNWYLHIRAEDYAGNATEATSASFTIDNTPPTLTIEMKDEDDESYPGIAPDGWSTKNVTVTAIATDTISASVPIAYTSDGGQNWGPYTDPITLEDDGVYTIGFKAQDATGNVTMVNRTVKIAKKSLKLTQTLTNARTGEAYTSGEWVNFGVKVVSHAETTTGNDITYNYTLYVNGEEIPHFPNFDPTTVPVLIFTSPGVSTGDFTVSDDVNTLVVPYIFKVDNKSPIVTFSPDGNATEAGAASVTVTVRDDGGSGVDDSTLKYVWTQSPEVSPTDGWLPLNNGSTLTKEGVDGKWYLLIQGQDSVGYAVCREDDDQCINVSTTHPYAVSNAFELKNAVLNSTLSVTSASFDKKASEQADVMTEMTLNGNALTGISNGSTALLENTDYTVGGNSVTILKSYLAEQSTGTTASLTFTFSGGSADQTLAIEINDTTPQNSAISPDIANFDKKASAQADVVTTLTLNGNTLDEISNGGTPLTPNTDYTVSGDTVTISKTYLAAQPIGTASLKFTFSLGAAGTLILTISDTTPTNSTISPTTGTFDKKPSEQADVTTTMTLDGNVLISISNGSVALVPETDYTVSGDTVTISKSYLAEQPTGTTSLTFKFSTGEDQMLTITVDDMRPSEATPVIAIDYANEELTGFAADGTYTIDGTAVAPTAGKLVVESYLGQTLAIVKKGDVTTTRDSNVQNLVVPARPAAPTATVVNPTTIGGVGKITGVTAAMEYKSSTGDWTDVTGSEIDGLAVGTYQVRVKSTATGFASAAQNITITVIDDSTHTVTYNGNGATSGSAPTDNASYADGVMVSVYGNTGNLIKSGYTFAGWNTQADGNGTDFAAGATFTMGTANVTLYARWKSNNADLIDLTMPGSTLTPTFAAATTSYKVNVTNSRSSIAVTATVSDAVYATMTATVYNNTGTITSGPIPLTSGAVSPVLSLNVGSNLIRLDVVAADGTTKIYTVTVNRASSNGGSEGSGGGPTTPSTEPGEEQAPEEPTKEPSTDLTPTITFSDIAGHWAAAYIKQAVSGGIVTGYPGGTFKPNRTVTRAEFAVMLINALKLQGEGAALTFTDTAKIGSWARKAVTQAVQAGIIAGYEDGSFRPDAEITRTEMAMMLANALRLSHGANVATGFADDKDIPAWAKGAVAAVKKHGYVEGKGSNEFDPQGRATRAEAVTVLIRMLAQKS